MHLRKPVAVIFCCIASRWTILRRGDGCVTNRMTGSIEPQLPTEPPNRPIIFSAIVSATGVGAGILKSA
jgi:hypothetical protein